MVDDSTKALLDAAAAFLWSDQLQAANDALWTGNEVDEAWLAGESVELAAAGGLFPCPGDAATSSDSGELTPDSPPLLDTPGSAYGLLAPTAPPPSPSGAS